MFKADVFCPFLVLMFLAACAGSERTAHLPTAPPDADVSEIDCNRPHERDNVHVTAEQFAKRFGASAEKLAEVQSTLARPVEVCGVSQEPIRTAAAGSRPAVTRRSPPGTLRSRGHLT
jgi:hypothetical protein